ncbi:hypothetical protein BN440_0565 [Erwinia amylovora MR1]|nr:hypothetical protein BN440_0565 [Erwinia amylovora MR1]
MLPRSSRSRSPAMTGNDQLKLMNPLADRDFYKNTHLAHRTRN